MHTTRTRILLAGVGLATALLIGACDTAQQVPWATYNSQLQQRIDAATANRDREEAAVQKAEAATAADARLTRLARDRI